MTTINAFDQAIQEARRIHANHTRHLFPYNGSMWFCHYLPCLDALVKAMEVSPPDWRRIYVHERGEGSFKNDLARMRRERDRMALEITRGL